MEITPQSSMAVQAPPNANAAPAPAAIAPATPPDVPLIMPPPSGPARVTPAYAAADAERVTKFPAEPWCLPPDHARPPLPALPLLTEQRQPVQALPEQRMSELWQIRTPKPPQKPIKRRRITDIKPPPAVGSKIRVHTFPENDESKPAEWFPAVVCRCHPPPKKKRTGGSVEIIYDEDGSVDFLDWPEDGDDIEVVESADWDPDELAKWSHKGGRRGRRPPPPPPPENVLCDMNEAAHLIYFALLQLRSEYAEIVIESGGGRCSSSKRTAYDIFDRECASITQSEDLKSSEPLVEAFLTGPCARGDKWMPWHCALGAHERYLLEVVRRLPRLSDELSRSVITFAFSGSRDIELFETLLRPLFEQHASEEDAALGQLLIQKPFEALRRGGDLCRRYEAYRLRGKKLHTTCYQCHPPAGAAGSEFVFYIVDRTARFAELGRRVHAFLERGLGRNFFESGQLAKDAVIGDSLRVKLEGELLAEREVGPTMAKMFLVSTHLAFPQAHLLDASCAVGDGAEQAFDYLYPHVQARARSAHRAVLLDALTAQLDEEALDRLEPRLRPMLRFVGGAARARFGLCSEQVSDAVTPFDLQVHLCEWRKFRTRVDRMRLCRRGSVLDRTRALRAVEAARRTRRSPSARG